MTKWPLFASGEAQLPANERAELQNFLEQWTKWNGWLTSARIPTYERLAFKVRQLKGAQSGRKLVLYGLDELSTQKEGSERIYLPPPADMAKPRALILAPRIEGLRQQISAAGDTVEYLDDQGQPLLKVDAFRMWNNTFIEYVQSRYGGSNKAATLFPRFRFFIPGVEAGFFLLEKNLSLKQIIFLEKTLELYNSPALEPLKTHFFAEKKIYVVVAAITEVPNASGLASAGIAVLDQGDLFHYQDDLAATIAHEAAHVMQVMSKTDRCAYEIGDGTIPAGFKDWTADHLVSAIEDRADRRRACLLVDLCQAEERANPRSKNRKTRSPARARTIGITAPRQETGWRSRDHQHAGQTAEGRLERPHPQDDHDQSRRLAHHRYRAGDLPIRADRVGL